MNKGTKEPVAQKRGFYIALYSVLAALLVLAAVISYNNYTSVTRARELRAQIAAEELAAANASRVESYRTLEAARTNPTPAPAAPTTPAVPRVTATPVPRSTTPAAPAPATQQQTTTPAESPAPAQPPPAAAQPPAAPSATPAPRSAPAQQSHADDYYDDTRSQPMVELFTEGDTMRWPVLGEIVMDFSADRMIFDRTLEHFRTNDVLCIATDIGTPVLAASSGVVKSVRNTRELGNTIVLDHGNGWTTGYSQLQDGVLVRVGDTVSAGQVIGGVGTPSLYYVLLGTHLGFSVAHDDSYIDPKGILE